MNDSYERGAMSGRLVLLIQCALLSVSSTSCGSETSLRIDVRGIPEVRTAYSQVRIAQDSLFDAVFQRTCPRVLAIAESALVELAPDSLAAKIGSREATRACGKNALSCWLSVSVHYDIAWQFVRGRLDEDDVPEDFEDIFDKARPLQNEVRVMMREGLHSLEKVTTNILADSLSAVSRNAGALDGNGRLVLKGLQLGDGLLVLVRDSNKVEGARIHVPASDSLVVTPYDTINFDLIAPCRVRG